MAAGVRTEPSFDSGGALLGKVDAVNGLSIPVTASSFRAPRCRDAEGMTEGGATEPSFDIGGTSRRREWAINQSDCQQFQGAEVQGWGGYDRGWRYGAEL